MANAVLIGVQTDYMAINNSSSVPFGLRITDLLFCASVAFFFLFVFFLFSGEERHPKCRYEFPVAVVPRFFCLQGRVLDTFPFGFKCRRLGEVMVMQDFRMAFPAPSKMVGRTSPS